MALPPSTANWHWKNKNVTKWAEDWMKRELTAISVKGDKGEIVSISNVLDVDGDVELGQRKSKLITIFDTKVSLSWKATATDGTEATGSLTIPEVSHEVICDRISDFTYQWSLDSDSSPEVKALFALAKSRLPAAIESKLATFPNAIVETHAKDITVSAEPSRAGSPAPSSGPQQAPASVARSKLSQPIRSGAGGEVNTTTVVVDATFQASAEDLYTLLTDEKKIPMWSRAPALSTAAPGTEYSLFGGGVRGKYISLTKPKQIVQSWFLQSPTWPSGHSATMTINLDQSTDSTKVTFTLSGVPLGIEDEIKKNIEGYYIHGFKSIGYVQLVLLERSAVSSHTNTLKRSSPSSRRTDKNASSSTSSYVPAVVIAAIVLAAAFSIPYLSSTPASK